MPLAYRSTTCLVASCGLNGGKEPWARAVVVGCWRARRGQPPPVGQGVSIRARATLRRGGQACARARPRGLAHARSFRPLSLSLPRRLDLSSVSRSIDRSLLRAYVRSSYARALAPASTELLAPRRPLGSVVFGRVPAGLVRSHNAGWLAGRPRAKLVAFVLISLWTSRAAMMV